MSHNDTLYVHSFPSCTCPQDFIRVSRALSVQQVSMQKGNQYSVPGSKAQGRASGLGGGGEGVAEKVYNRVFMLMKRVG